MATILNADTVSGGAIITGDGSGTLELQAAGVTKLTVNSSGVTIPTLIGANVNLASNVTGTLPIANGGTGAATLTANNVLLGNGTSALQAIAPGTSGNVLASNGTTWASSAISGLTSKSFVATGTISSGAPVALTASGTVQAVYPANTSISNVTPQTVATSTTVTNFFGSAISSNGSIVTFFANDTLSLGSAVVSTVSGTTVTSGALNTIYAGAIEGAAVCYDSLNDDFVFIYKPTAIAALYAVVGTVSGTTISLGTPVLVVSIASLSPSSTSATFDSTNGKVVITYTASTISSAIVGTVSGTSISFGTATQYATSGINVSSCFHQSAGKVVISYAISTTPYAIVGTVSGTSISFGTAVSLGSITASTGTAIVYDPVYTKVIIGWRDGANYVARAGVVSGTSITAQTQGTLYPFNGGSGIFYGAYDLAAKQAVFGFSITGTTMLVWCSALTPTIVALPQLSTSTGGTTTKPTVVYDPITFQIIAFSRTTTTVYASAMKQVYSSNSTNFYGFAESAISSGASGNITMLSGINNVQTGLVANTPYYLNASPTLATTGATYVGVALSPTSIQVGSIAANPRTSMVLLSSVTVAAGSTAIEFPSVFSAQYDQYLAVISCITATNGSRVDWQAYRNGAYVAGTNYTYYVFQAANATPVFSTATTQPSAMIANTTNNGQVTLNALFTNTNSTAQKMTCIATGLAFNFIQNSGSQCDALATTQGIKFIFGGGSSTVSGTIKIYGLVN